jgi:hypothetical protein
MSHMGHSRPGRPSSKSGHVGYSAESGSRFSALAVPLWRFEPCRLDDTAVRVIQAPETGASNHAPQTQPAASASSTVHL